MKKNVKIVVVGDGSCGKTSLIHAHVGSEFHDEYTPTAFDDYAIEALVNGKMKTLTVSDTAGEEEFTNLRPLSYPEADVFIVCYTVDDPESLEHLRSRWLPEIKHFCPTTPMIVVGNKKDIRDEGYGPLVDLEEAQKFTKEVSHQPLIECSAKTRENVRLVFDTAITAAVQHRSRYSNKVIQSIMKLKVVF